MRPLAISLRPSFGAYSSGSAREPAACDTPATRRLVDWGGFTGGSRPPPTRRRLRVVPNPPSTVSPVPGREWDAALLRPPTQASAAERHTSQAAQADWLGNHAGVGLSPVLFCPQVSSRNLDESRSHGYQNRHVEDRGGGNGGPRTTGRPRRGEHLPRR